MMTQQLNWDPLNTGQLFGELFASMSRNPEKLMQANLDLWKQGLELYQRNLENFLGGDSEPTPNTDRRFRHEAWTQQPVFNAIRESYLMLSKHVERLVDETEGLDEKTAARAEFFTRLILDAMSPTNFAGTNPEVIERVMETSGMNLVNGFNNLVRDMKAGDGQLRIAMTDYDAFELGVNVATTPGKVVFENRMFQLIQYAPQTEQVSQVPLLIVPPWINKYYILDLQQKNSLIHWLVSQGHTVFIMSWVNPDESYSDVGFENYVLEGVLEAMDQVALATGEDKVNTIGYCIGGTLLATSLAVLAGRDDNRVNSATFLTTMLDFSCPGELGVFIDKEQLDSLDEKMDQQGFLDGKEMATTFNLLRSNDLIWSFYISNYLLGNDPRPFDLLYWNSDSTRMPAKMHKWYLRNLYLKNRLIESGDIEIDGTSLDLSAIKTPAMFVSAEEDHIAPWQSTWLGARKLGGPVKFILGGSGHIAGICNPPANNKYGYRISSRKLGKDSAAWKDRTEKHDGSWWPAWNEWVSKFAGDQVPARIPGDGKLQVIEDAPGRYVKMK